MCMTFKAELFTSGAIKAGRHAQPARNADLIYGSKDGELGDNLNDCRVIGEDEAYVLAEHQEGHSNDQVEAAAPSEAEVSCRCLKDSGSCRLLQDLFAVWNGSCKAGPSRCRYEIQIGSFFQYSSLYTTDVKDFHNLTRNAST